MLERFKSTKRHKILKKFQIQLDKELDLEKFIQRLRLLVFTAIGTMTANQSIFADKMSQVVVRESSDFESTSSDEELDHKKERNNFIISAKRLIRSSDKTDKRFINIFKVGKANQNAKEQKILVE